MPGEGRKLKPPWALQRSCLRQYLPYPSRRLQNFSSLRKLSLPGVEKCSRCTFSIAQFRDPPPYDFAPLFILLCLTTIHHHINRKLSSSKTENLLFATRSRALSVAGLSVRNLNIYWYVWRRLVKFMAKTLDVAWNIIEISFYSVSFLCGSGWSVCTLAYYICPLRTRVWHRERIFSVVARLRGEGDEKNRKSPEPALQITGV